jgi:hypothetical protein
VATNATTTAPGPEPLNTCSAISTKAAIASVTATAASAQGTTFGLTSPG